MKYTFNYDLLVEGKLTIQDKYNMEKQNGKTNLDFPFYKQICETDPTYNRQTGAVGQYANWLLLRVKTPEELDSVKVPLEWFADGVKRGVLKNSGIKLDISQYHSVDEFVNTMNQVMQGDNSDSFAMSESEQNNRQKLQGQFNIIGTSANWELIQPLTWQAERWFGRETKWCTVANKDYFNQYGGDRGKLYIFYPKSTSNLKYRIQACPNSDQFADVDDNVSDTLEGALFGLDNTIQEKLEIASLTYSEKYNGFPVDNYKLTNSEHLSADDVTKILDYATNIGDKFFHDKKIKSIVIPNCVTTIDSMAFAECTSLASITIPGSVTSIAADAFLNCESLTSITVDTANTNYSSVDGVLFNYTKDTLIQYPVGNKRTSYTIPNSVTKIGESAFNRCSSLASITIPNSVTSIEDYAFFYCQSLTHITVPSSIIHIGKSAFFYIDTIIYNGTAEGAPWGAFEVIRSANENKIMVSDSSLSNMIYESLFKILEEGSNIIHQLGLSKKEAENRLRKATREYFETHEPHNLEIAEHCTYIVAKAFDFPSKEDVDVCDVNFSWMNSVIGDEIIKIGGSYDTEDVDKHAKKIKKAIKEALKYHQ